MTARRLLLPSALVLLSAASASAAPRMISYGYNSCVSCHVSVQGRGLLNAYGRGIDMAQSYSKKDFTAMLLGRPSGHEDTSQNWDGRFENVLLDFLASFRASHRFDEEKTDPGFFGVYRQAIFLGEGDRFRIHTEVGVLDGGLHDVSLGPALTSTGGDVVFLRKAVLEWRLSENDSTSGHELVFGRDYLPLGLQIDDHLAYILHLNRAGIYDYPLQLKYFAWNEKSLGSAFVFGPSFEEGAGRREYGGGFLYERYPAEKLVLGVQGLVGFSDESDRLRIGPYVRWGISEKWALLAQADYGRFWDGGNQATAFLQLFHHHLEWLVSSATLNFAYTEALGGQDRLTSFRYVTAARLNRNFTIGVSYLAGATQRNLSDAHEVGIFATFKF